MNSIRFWRQERGLSQYELSQATEVERWKIQLIEQGHRAASTTERMALAVVLGISEDKLFGAQSKEVSCG